MNVERNLPAVRDRKIEILKGDPELCAQQKKAGKLIARERIGLLLDAASFVELDALNSEAVEKIFLAIKCPFCYNNTSDFEITSREDDRLSH